MRTLLPKSVHAYRGHQSGRSHRAAGVLFPVAQTLASAHTSGLANRSGPPVPLRIHSLLRAEPQAQELSPPKNVFPASLAWGSPDPIGPHGIAVLIAAHPSLVFQHLAPHSCTMKILLSDLLLLSLFSSVSGSCQKDCLTCREKLRPALDSFNLEVGPGATLSYPPSLPPSRADPEWETKASSRGHVTQCHMVGRKQIPIWASAECKPCHLYTLMCSNKDLPMLPFCSHY